MTGETHLEQLERALEALRRDIARAGFDAMFQQFKKAGVRPYLVMRLGRIKIKMYQEPGHATPHVHIDFGRESHCASYAIDPIRVLAGSLPKAEDKLVRRWVVTHTPTLLSVWMALQKGERFELELEEE